MTVRAPVLVTGATGFTGGHLARTLARRGYAVRALVRPASLAKPAARALEAAGVTLAAGDLTDAAAVARACEGVEVVYHIAATYREAGQPDSAYRAINVDGTRIVIDSARQAGARRVVHCSTGGVHGHIEHPPATEDAPLRPGDIYQETKLEAEQLARAAGEQAPAASSQSPSSQSPSSQSPSSGGPSSGGASSGGASSGGASSGGASSGGPSSLGLSSRGPGTRGLEVTIVRPIGIYGPGDMRFLKMFRGIARGRFPMLGAGEVFYHLTFIDDLVEGFRLCGEVPQAAGRTYILGGPRYTTLNELARLMAEALGVRPPWLRLPVWPFWTAGLLCELICVPLRVEPPLYRRRVDFYTKSRAFDITRARNELGYAPAVDLEAGLRRTIEWYREQGLL